MRWEGALYAGGLYLLAGAPGVGKTTLINQTLGNLAQQGRKVLYISTEQTPGEFKTALERIHGMDSGLSANILDNMFLDNNVEDVGDLSKFF